MLQDIDLKYVSGILTTGAGLAVPSLTVAGQPVTGGPTTPATAQPSDHGLTSWVDSPTNATQASPLANGSLYLSTVYIRAATTISKCWWIATAGATTPTAGANWIGLYNLTGTLLSSAAIDTPIASNGPQNATLTAAQAVAAGRYWVGILTNASTPPTMARMGGQSASGNSVGLTAANYRFAINGTGITTLPASITPASNSLTSVLALWTGVS